MGADLPAGTEQWLFLGFALAFAIKTPIFPLHTWLPSLYRQSPAATLVVATMLAKVGGLRIHSDRNSAIPGPGRDLRALAGRPSDHWNNLRRPGCLRPTRHDQRARLFQHRPLGIHRVGNLRRPGEGTAGGGCPNGQPRYQRRDALRTCSHDSRPDWKLRVVVAGRTGGAVGRRWRHLRHLQSSQRPDCRA